MELNSIFPCLQANMYYSLVPSFFAVFQLNTYMRTMVSITSHPTIRKLENPKIIVFVVT